MHALIAAPLLMAAWLAVVPAHAEDTPFISIVTGLAPDDLLNIRAEPSPMGKTEARVAAGASVRNLGCNDIDGHPWCKVVSDNPSVTGWAPARYLVPVNPATVPESDQPADASTVATATDAGPDATTPPPPPAPVPAQDLTQRLGGTDPGAPKSAAEIGRTAMQDAYGLAFAANENSPTGEVPAALAPAAGAPAQDSNPAAVATAEAAPAPGTTADIPCARYVGQPMMQCQINVAHTGGDSAVTVTWPDGGTRIISFHGGLPVGSDSPDEFRFTREGSLNMIRIGASERFEIIDAVATGG
ncbi:SH3 domain-containing protein [Mesorhizobium sp. PL10]